MSRRQARVNDLLQEVIAEIIARDLKDPRLETVLISVTEVQASPDFRQALVRISMLGPEEQQDAAWEALQRSATFIRRQMYGRVDLKAIPFLRFERDQRIADARRVHDMLDMLEHDNPSDEPSIGSLSQPSQDTL